MVNFPGPCPEFPISVHTTSKAPWASFSHLLATVLHNGEARGRQSAFDFLHTPPPPSNVGGATPACLCGSAHQHWMGVGGSGVSIRSDSIAGSCQAKKNGSAQFSSSRIHAHMHRKKYVRTNDVRVLSTQYSGSAFSETRSAYSETRSAYSETRSAFSETRSAYSEARSAFSETRSRTLKSDEGSARGQRGVSAGSAQGQRRVSAVS